MAAKKRFHGDYERRTKAMEQGGMIGNDESQIANVPQSVVYRAYPRTYSGMPDDSYNDTMDGIDRQMDKDDSQARKFMNPKKY